MNNNDNITIEEKIDYIYERMQKQHKIELFSWVVKWGTRLLFLISILYFLFVKLPVLKDEFIESLTPKVPTFDSENITDSDLLNSIKDKFWDFDVWALLENNSSNDFNNLDF